ncbi:septation protein SepH [Terrabacter sp. BE26]|uniref:septation protein SepH n=1 Tax=Terrabacter sp. BE26 TaxID=2898152 RepID=UPI0035BE3397
MQHLRLVGVHEDGLHLLLADDEGSRYSLPLDDALRAAARRDRPRLGQLQIETSGGLRPKDVQAMIRAGMTAEDVADRAGWTVEKVHRYEGPILAEREHVAGLARQVRLRPRGGSHGTAPTLDTRVTERLRAREIDAGSARWDSRRTDKGAWTVVLLFNAGGRRREALWQFDPLARTVSPVDDEARWLSEDEDQQAPGPIPAPHLTASTRPSRVYDVEAEGGVGASATRRREGETVDLMAAIRERSSQRGRRRRPKSAEVPGLDEAPEEALPLEELARDPRDELPPPAHTHPEDDPEVIKTGSMADRVGADAARRQARRTEPTQPVRQARTVPPEAAGDEPTGRTTDDGVRPAGEADTDGVAGVANTVASTVDDTLETSDDAPSDLGATSTIGETRFARPSDGSADREETGDAKEPEQPEDFEPQASHELEPADSAEADEAERPVDADGSEDSDVPDAPQERVAPEQPLRPAARRRDGSRPSPRLREGDERRRAADRGGRGTQSTPRRDGATEERGSARGGRHDRDDEGYDVVEQRPSASAPKPAPRPAPPARKSGRPSVPSWDDIMFGRKND